MIDRQHVELGSEDFASHIDFTNARASRRYHENLIRSGVVNRSQLFLESEGLHQDLELERSASADPPVDLYSPD